MWVRGKGQVGVEDTSGTCRFSVRVSVWVRCAENIRPYVSHSPGSTLTPTLSWMKTHPYTANIRSYVSLVRTLRFTGPDAHPNMSVYLSDEHSQSALWHCIYNRKVLPPHILVSWIHTNPYTENNRSYMSLVLTHDPKLVTRNL